MRLILAAGRAGAGRTTAERDRLSYAGEDGMRSGGGNSAQRDYLRGGSGAGFGKDEYGNLRVFGNETSNVLDSRGHCRL